MDQRRAQRYGLRLPILVTQMGSAQVERIGTTLDISSAGVLFESLVDMQPGDRIEFVITLSASRSEVKLRCLGKVLRVVRRSDPEARFEIAASIDRYQFARAPKVETATAIA